MEIIVYFLTMIQVIVCNIIFCNNEKIYKIIGTELKKHQNLYNLPSHSSLVSTHVTKLVKVLNECPISSIKNKMWKILLSEDLYAVNLLLHV